ncbi:MAG: hypothetical protein LBQ77_05975 [Treponema sp.]|nr:hypothetical protein [Treponema sp.]
MEPNILIVIDNDSSIQMMAELIAAAFSQSRIVKADSFVGSDLLDAHIYFFGCKEPSPFSFNHVEKVLQHVNLAGRSCGIFSLDSEQAIAYLKRILLDSELTVYPQAFLSDSMENLEAWASRIVNVQGNDNV